MKPRTLRIKGNLIVDGSQTIIHSTRVDISDTNIKLGINAPTKSDLSGAGIDISNVATFRYNNDKWNTNIGLNISGDLDVRNINNVPFNDLSNIVTHLDNSCIKFNNIPDFPDTAENINKYLSVSSGVFEWKEVNLEGTIGSAVNGLQTNIDNSFDDVYIKSYIDTSFQDVYNKNYIDLSFNDVYNKNYIDLSFNDVYNKNYIDLSFNNVYTKEQVKNDVNINTGTFSIIDTTLQINYNKLYSYNEVTRGTTTINKIENIASAANIGQQFIINIIPTSGATVTLNGKSSNLSKFNGGNTVYINFEDDIICNGSNKESILVTACRSKK